MKPSQRIVLACRQTADGARRLCDWLDANPVMLGVGHAGLIDEIEGLSSVLAPIALAAETAPSIAVIGADGAGKADLVLQLVGQRGPAEAGELGARPVDFQTLRQVLSQETGSGGCLAVRLTTSDLSGSPRGYPIRFSLLSEIDCAAILALSRLAAAGPPPVAPTPAELDAMFSEAGSQVSLQTITGITGRDIIELREALVDDWADHPFIGALSAMRYFERLREIAAHLKEDTRRRLLSVLWGRDEATTTLFTKLYEVLDYCGHGGEVFATPDALIGKDRLTGWLTRHPSSIADTATLRAWTTTPDPGLTVMTRFGQVIDVERPALAALVSELTLQAGESRLAELAPADLIDFPAPPIAIDAGGAGLPGLDQFGACVDRFARLKPSYLFQRACRRRDITCLVAVVEPYGNDDAVSAWIGDWVEMAQGATEAARDRIRRGLFIAAPAAGLKVPTDRQKGRDRVLSNLRAIAGVEEPWLRQWTSEQAANEIYWFTRGGDHRQPLSSSETSAGRRSLAALHSADGTDRNQDLPAPLARRSDTTASRKADAASAHGTGSPLSSHRRAQHGIGELTIELRRAATARVKVMQLSRAITETRRAVRHGILRHHTSSDPIAQADWRRSMATLISNRLLMLEGSGRIGLLLKVLTPSYHELRLAIGATRLAGEPNAFGDMPFGSKVAERITLFENLAATPADDLGRLAAAAVAHWTTTIRRRARSRRVCRELGVEGAILQHIAEELQIGAVRIGLAERVASRVHYSGRRSDPQSDDRLAAYAFRHIAGYVEALVEPGNLNQASAAARYLQETVVAETSDQGYRSAGGENGSYVKSSRVQFTWEPSFAALVEENILASNLSSQLSDKDRELANLIQLFAPGPFEVDA